MTDSKFHYDQNASLQKFCLKDYDFIGFDLDHTICEYKLKPLMSLIYKSLASYLVSKYKYPKSLSDFDDSLFYFAQKGIILDKYRGNFLKLDNKYKIVKASHGTTFLSDEEIKDIYNPNGIWEESKGVPHKLVTKSDLDKPYYVFKDYFVTVGAVICAKIVDILDEKNGKPLNEYNFWEHYVDGLHYIYDKNNFKNNTGEFYPALKNNPEMYIKPCSDSVKNWVKNIHENKVTFLLTSSNYDVAVFLAECCLGKDWKDYFDFIVTFACKPNFFWSDTSFYFVDNNTEVHSIKPEEMEKNSIYSQGNWKDFQKVFSMYCKIPNPKIIYFGDSIMEDVYAASEIAHWDSVAVVEEMFAEGVENMSGVHTDAHILVSKFWGSFFGLKTYVGDNGTSLSLWTYLLSQHSKLAIPNLESISRLGLQDEVPCFGTDMEMYGFFPGKPKILSTN